MVDRSVRRKVGKTLVAVAFPAAVAIPLWRYLGPFTCGAAWNSVEGLAHFVPPLLSLTGWLVLIARKPRSLGYWAAGIAGGLVFWVLALYSTACEH